MARKKLIRILVGLTAIGLILCNQPSKGNATYDEEPFLGRWALFLPGGAGWLEVRQEKSHLDGDLLWYGGSVTPVISIVSENDTLVVTRSRHTIRKRDADGNPVGTKTLTTWLECVLVNGELTGKAFIPNRTGNINVTEFTGRRIPTLPPAPDLSRIKYNEPVMLFNGQDLTGWTLI